MPQSVFPMQGSGPEHEQTARVVPFEEADAMIEALTSETARSIVAALEDEPMSPAALAGRVETSIQNVLYHLDRLADAALVEVVGTDYSARGNEMDVYAPTGDPVVICIGDDQSEQTLSRIIDDGQPTAELANSD